MCKKPRVGTFLADLSDDLRADLGVAFFAAAADVRPDCRAVERTALMVDADDAGVGTAPPPSSLSPSGGVSFSIPTPTAPTVFSCSIWSSNSSCIAYQARIEDGWTTAQ